ncbi:septum site-determining protein MinC [Rhizobium sp. WYJ-E13]|uniref:septum site-determining protein MinC n=1 Tax=Rhizobium sp. WYJ-E13 TaxID=2849093 RepID=UPI001C1EA69F|nr:septum site-determining protein MinC [Rhizobium sp. WYJ-E13]QWW71914.1 septum site-determining protein MinC [Rhizobium sp. WYJ-E13]
MLTEARSIRIKGRSFLAVVLTPDLPFEDWLVRLDDLAARSAGFFLGRPVVLDVTELSLDRAALKAMVQALGERNVRVMGIEGARPSQLDASMPPGMAGGRPAADVDVPTAEVKAEGKAPHKAKPAEVQEVAAPIVRAPVSSLVLHEPVRSGQSIIFPEGDVTVIGSIASGAEVIAGGSIHIYGALRGRALAGSVGNSAARIFCRKLEAELLAIDGIYKTADDLPAELRGQSAQLWLENEAIMASRLI